MEVKSWVNYPRLEHLLKISDLEYVRPWTYLPPPPPKIKFPPSRNYSPFAQVEKQLFSNCSPPPQIQFKIPHRPPKKPASDIARSTSNRCPKLALELIRIARQKSGIAHLAFPLKIRVPNSVWKNANVCQTAKCRIQFSWVFIDGMKCGVNSTAAPLSFNKFES